MSSARNNCPNTAALVKIRTPLSQYLPQYAGLDYFTLLCVNNTFRSIIKEFEDSPAYKSAEFQKTIIGMLLNKKAWQINEKILQTNLRLGPNDFGNPKNTYSIPILRITPEVKSIDNAYRTLSGSANTQLKSHPDKVRETNGHQESDFSHHSPVAHAFISFGLVFLGLGIGIYGLAENDTPAIVAGAVIVVCTLLYLEAKQQLEK